GAIVLGAGALQFTAWKARHLACCRDAARCGGPSPASVGAAWRQGVRFGVRCCCCSAGLTTSLLVAGIMDWRAMAAVTAAIAVERLAPAGERAARMIGGGVAAMGAVMVARAAGLG
ncbi:copper chaperone, partial [Burkholderia humptydooensis]